VISVKCNIEESVESSETLQGAEFIVARHPRKRGALTSSRFGFKVRISRGVFQSRLLSLNLDDEIAPPIRYQPLLSASMFELGRRFANGAALLLKLPEAYSHNS
jgi:hypothetical protein